MAHQRSRSPQPGHPSGHRQRRPYAAYAVQFSGKYAAERVAGGAAGVAGARLPKWHGGCRRVCAHHRVDRARGCI